MKNTIKLLMIFIGGLTAIIVGAIGGYFIIAQNKTFYIYDVRLVEPVEGKVGYIYTDSETEYTSLKNMSIHKNGENDDMIQIAVLATSSTNSKEVSISSSDTSIAKIVYKYNKCYVQLLKEGVVTITSEMYGVSDSIDIEIYDQLPSDFTVFDYEYYGDYYAEKYPNRIISYADGKEYRYKYNLNNVSGTGNNSNVDGKLLRVDSISSDVFERVAVDADTNELIVVCKEQDETQKENIYTTIVLQSFYYTEDGSIVKEKTYPVNVRVVLDIPEFLQIEISSTQDFAERTVFTNTKRRSLSESEIDNDEDLLDKYLAAEKAENYLLKNSENATYNVYLTNQAKRIFYIRFRMVYTNGDIEYLVDSENATLVFPEDGCCKIGPTGDYYSLETDKSCEITVSVKDYDLEYTFQFELKNSVKENRELFYDYNKETKIYTFKYWDVRARFTNEIFDKFGNVIGFGESL